MNAIERKRYRLGSTAWALALVSVLPWKPGADALEIEFQYTTDTTGFFAEGTEARRVLESAGELYELLLEDKLGELVASGVNTLTVSYINPSTQTLVTVTPPPIPADTLLVYVGATNLAGAQLGMGYRGGITPRGLSDAWFDYVDTRGQIGIVYGAGANEVAPWGGSLAVDTVDASGAPRQWDYSLGVRPAESSLHLYSLLIHELGHVLGFGSCDAWNGRVDTSGHFTGSRAVAVYGAKVPLDSQASHWKRGIASAVHGRAAQQAQQETAMNPNLPSGAAIYMTELDIAGFRDIGWEIGEALPEPVPPALGMAMSPAGGSMVLSWEGESHYKYTVLKTTDFTRWQATGPTLPGIPGPMQAAIQTGGDAIGYRLLLEHRPTALLQPLAMAVAVPEAEDETDGAILRSRSRPGAGAMRWLGEGPEGGDAHWCGTCARESAGWPDGSLRKKGAARLDRRVGGESF